MSEAPVTLFGNPVSASAQRKAASTRRRFERKYRYDPEAFYPLSAAENPILGPMLGVRNVVSEPGHEKLDHGKGILIGTIRMGYGHYRIAMAAASAARALGYTPYWFDLLGFDTAGARMIRDLDKWYSRGSRLSQKSKLFNRFFWDPLMGKWYKGIEKNYPIMQAAHVFANIYKDLPSDMPLLGTHPWNALGAVHAGMTNVVNMIPDNCPLGFHLVEGAIQTVQSPSSYLKFRTLAEIGPKIDGAKGVPAADIRLTSHYIDHELVENIEVDCTARLKRIADKAPRRLLISIGGAGAQQKLLVEITRLLLPQVQAGKTTLFINFGDHRTAWDYFNQHIPGFDALVQKHFAWDDAVQCANQAVNGEVSGLHAFLNPNAFCAVYTTNLLMRGSDLLLTKPSELAFYPIPKLLLERVGGHEAWGAIRAAELGDGTIECPGRLAFQALDLLLNEDDVLTQYCAMIPRLKTHGIYNGAYEVVRLAKGA